MNSMCNPKYVEYFNIISTYLSSISYIASSYEDTACPCRYKIIATQTVFWLDWFTKNAIRTSSMSTKEVISSLKKLKVQLFEDLKEKTSVSFSLLDFHYTLGDLLFEEVTDLLERKIGHDPEENIYTIGEMLVMIIRHTIAELNEARIPCCDIGTGNVQSCKNCWYYNCFGETCEHHTSSQNQSENSIMLFFTDMMAVNSFGVKKIRLVGNKLVANLKNTKLILDFSEYTGEFTSKIGKVIDEALLYFNYVSVVNYRIDMSKLEYKSESFSFMGGTDELGQVEEAR